MCHVTHNNTFLFWLLMYMYNVFLLLLWNKIYWLYSAVQCSAVQCSAVQCSAVQCSAVQCSAVQYSTVQLLTKGWYVPMFQVWLREWSQVSEASVMDWGQRCTGSCFTSSMSIWTSLTMTWTQSPRPTSTLTEWSTWQVDLNPRPSLDW